MSSGARSQSFTSGSAAMSTAPSATRRVREEVAAPHPPHRVGEADEGVAASEVGPSGQAGERQAGRASSATATPTACAARSPPTAAKAPRLAAATIEVQRRRATTPTTGTPSSSSAIRLATPGRRYEVLGAVDGVDHPLPAAECRRPAVLLTEDPVVRALAGQDGAQVGLDGFVGVGDRRQVRLGVDPQIQGAEPVERDRVGALREFQRHLEVCPHPLAAHGCSPTMSAEFAVPLLIIGALVLVVGPRFMRRGPRGEALQGTLLVTGSARGPMRPGSSSSRSAGSSTGPRSVEHVGLSAHIAVDVDSWPTMGQLIPSSTRQEPGQLELRPAGTDRPTRHLSVRFHPRHAAGGVSDCTLAIDPADRSAVPDPQQFGHAGQLHPRPPVRLARRALVGVDQLPVGRR